jgi:hypothetical protein
MDKLLAGMLIAVAGSQVAFALGLPVLQQGQLYRVEREKLLAGGWQKVITLGLNCVSKYPSSSKTGRFDSFKRETCFKYQEHQDCSAQGHCLFLWRNAEGSTLRVVTFGYEHALLNWSLE